jgi:hypothetical protein
VLYFAPIPPLASQFARLMARLQAQPQPDPGVEPQADTLLHRLKAGVLPRALV